MFQVSPAHWCRTLWSQRYLVAAFIGEGVHFFFDDIGYLTYATSEKAGIFEGRRVNALVAVELANMSHFLLYKAPVGLFPWQNV